MLGIKKNLFFIGIILLLKLTACNYNSSKLGSISSPNKQLKFYIETYSDSSICYTLLSGTDTVIERSPLGLMMDSIAYTKLKLLKATTPEARRDNYTLITGKHKLVETEFYECTFTFANNLGKIINIDVRAYNEGIAFRYSFNQTDTIIHAIDAEYTGFNLPNSGKAWIASYDKVKQVSSSYETQYTNGIAIGITAPYTEGWAFPMLFEAKRHFILISEAGLNHTYCASHINPIASNGLYTIKFPEYNEANDSTFILPKSKLPWLTPWRFIVIGKNLKNIVENTMPTNLSEASNISDVKWIKPGYSSWSWWGNWGSSRKYKSLKEYVDFAKEMGWAYSLVDANWNNMEGGNIEQLCQYAKQQGVGLFLWYNSGGPGNTVTEQPRDLMHNPTQRVAEMKKIAAWGVKGIKVDFFQSDKQIMIAQYLDILKDAANYKLMVNFHGCTLPRGWERTWPNLVNMEAVRGAEWYGFDANYPASAPSQNCIHPFLRNTIGQMDYTITTFGNQNNAHITSNAHELAMTIVFQGGVVHMADRIEGYKSQSQQVVNFLKTVPAQFDEIRFIEGYPGKYVIIARRLGNVWYVGGFNGLNNPLQTVIKLPFENKTVQLFADGLTHSEIIVENKTLSNNEMFVNMLPYGGFVAVIK